MNKNLKIILFFLFFFTFSFADDSLEKLSKSREWLILLHYKNGVSEIDDKSFFLSKEGKKDPYKELLATIKAFENYSKDDDNHPICKFPARYVFLKKHIDLKPKVKPTCKELNKFLEEVEPDSFYVVFSDAYINSPASMYGHTFLKISPPNKSDLLGYAVNYAARANINEGVKYYIKGIFGYYKGYFTIFPYYHKIHEYSYLESRDLWVYKLNLPKEKVRYLTLHIWELKDKYAYYYFFNKNCSYHLLHIINLAYPEYNFPKEFNYWTIPIDTVRSLEKKGLIEKVKYRPSATNSIKAFVQQNKDLTEEDIETAKKIAKFEINPQKFLKSNLPAEKKAKILELAKHFFIYYSIKGKMPQKEYKDRLLKLLSARSKVRYRFKTKTVIKKTPPHKGHKSSLISIGGGIEEDDSYISFLYRTAYHSLTDKPDGYIFGSEILFPYIELRYFPTLNKGILQEFNILKIRSYAIRDNIFEPISWNVYATVKREWFEKDSRNHFFKLGGGTGLSYGKDFKYLYYLGARSEINLSLNDFDNSNFRIGPDFLFLTNLDYLIFSLGFYPFYSLSNNSFVGYQLNSNINIPLSTNRALKIEGNLNRIDYTNIYDIKMYLNFFF